MPRQPIPCHVRTNEEIRSTGKWQVINFLRCRFIAYKLPASFKYVYLSPDLDDWKLSNKSVTSDGAMFHTYEAMFKLKNSDSAMYGMYNDEVPGNETRANGSSWGHMKGTSFDTDLPLG